MDDGVYFAEFANPDDPLDVETKRIGSKDNIPHPPDNPVKEVLAIPVLSLALLTDDKTTPESPGPKSDK